MVSADELTRWPDAFVAALKTQGMLVKAMPAPSVVCPGCERACKMPVETPVDSKGVVWPFVMCDKRSDTGRVPVPVGLVERWKSSVESVAQGLATLLDAPVASAVDASGKVWAVGSVRGKVFHGRVSLIVDGELAIEVSGRRVPLVNALALIDGSLSLLADTLENMADRPMDSKTENPAQRRARLAARATALQGAGERGFLKVLALEEDISVQRIKQILAAGSAEKLNVGQEVTLGSAWGKSVLKQKSRASSKEVKR